MTDQDGQGETVVATPPPPYVAVIFTSRRTTGDHGYAGTAEAMNTLVRAQPGYLGMESAHDEHLGITVSYWRDEPSARDWKQVAEHLGAQRLGRETWYEEYKVRICTVSREYGFDREGGRGPGRLGGAS